MFERPRGEGNRLEFRPRKNAPPRFLRCLGGFLPSLAFFCSGSKIVSMSSLSETSRIGNKSFLAIMLIWSLFSASDILFWRTGNFFRGSIHKICDIKNFCEPNFVQIWQFWRRWKAGDEIYPNLAKLNWVEI